ncbi:hypothetical protein PR048_007643 [Dryococelus australis]|uniref:Uncharacterized protein n=1 Tax=Dryococelus australis TaxID=614101 RepID=A0ABQ9HVP9_9NEOP|nr:hypothetical protein PR048_007643 [Dryococelus australis]
MMLQLLLRHVVHYPTLSGNIQFTKYQLTAVVTITRHQKWLVCKSLRDAVVVTCGRDTPPHATVVRVQAFTSTLLAYGILPPRDRVVRLYRCLAQQRREGTSRAGNNSVYIVTENIGYSPLSCTAAFQHKDAAVRLTADKRSCCDELLRYPRKVVLPDILVESFLIENILFSSSRSRQLKDDYEEKEKSNGSEDYTSVSPSFGIPKIDTEFKTEPDYFSDIMVKEENILLREDSSDVEHVVVKEENMVEHQNSPERFPNAWLVLTRYRAWGWPVLLSGVTVTAQWTDWLLTAGSPCLFWFLRMR